MPASVPQRCLLVDDNLRFLDAARRILELQGLPVVAVATTAAEAAAMARAHDPDVALVDIGLGHENGFAVAARLMAECPGLVDRVILISTREEDDLVELMDDNPAVWFLSKSKLSAGAVAALLTGT